MLTFVTGYIDSGKTAFMFELFEKLKHDGADGFVCPKVFSGGKFTGYDLLRLGNSNRVTLALLYSDYTGGFLKPVFFDRFVFNGESFMLGTDAISQAVTNEAIKHILIDEIGPLELRGEGFTGIIRLISDGLKIPGKDFYICVREGLLNSVLTAIGSPATSVIRV